MQIYLTNSETTAHLDQLRVKAYFNSHNWLKIYDNVDKNYKLLSKSDFLFILPTITEYDKNLSRVRVSRKIYHELKFFEISNDKSRVLLMTGFQKSSQGHLDILVNNSYKCGLLNEDKHVNYLSLHYNDNDSLLLGTFLNNLKQTI